MLKPAFMILRIGQSEFQSYLIFLSPLQHLSRTSMIDYAVALS